MSAVRLESVTKRFGAVTAVDDLDLEIRDGEFFSMLGPSGSGKTTVLRMIAGFEAPTSGKVFLGGDDVTKQAPFARNVNTVFQDYALFPHLDVLGNVEYGLAVKKVPRRERRQRAEEVLESVRLGGYGGRKPGQLSGGQRQRVALARALVNRPQVLLLDEPLGALDLKLRREMQIELKQLQRDVGITFVFVTHDQEEALTMSDRIAVFNQGRIEQVGTPVEIYDQPATTFVAGFVGTTNILPPAVAGAAGFTGIATVRPEQIRLATDDPAVGPDECHADGVVRDVVFLGTATRLLVELDAGGDLVVTDPATPGHAGEHALRRGTRVRAVWPRQATRTVAETEPVVDPDDLPVHTPTGGNP